MLVLVRFVDDEFDSRRFHVVHSSSIDNFSPTNPDDLDKKKIYEVFWIDPNEDGEDTGNYDAQILMMAENRDELDAKVAAKRVPVTNIKLIQPPAAASRKRKKNHQKSGKNAQYNEILAKDLQDAHKNIKKNLTTKSKARNRRFWTLLPMMIPFAWPLN